jgi:hypothetical protein
MGEVINLRRARKAKARDASLVEAQANRVRHGRTLEERQRDTLEAARLERRIDGHRLAGDDD